MDLIKNLFLISKNNYTLYSYNKGSTWKLLNWKRKPIFLNTDRIYVNENSEGILIAQGYVINEDNNLNKNNGSFNDRFSFLGKLQIVSDADVSDMDLILGNNRKISFLKKKNQNLSNTSNLDTGLFYFLKNTITIFLKIIHTFIKIFFNFSCISISFEKQRTKFYSYQRRRMDV